ncbi:MAG: cyclopropane-fatty-acyl-phospholipid synthase family protein [Pseudomonadales bacterium]|nr:cyclopropane-fatty-acyl-phospholipid synthase family protein [Pseudomonadales bacterium]
MASSSTNSFTGTKETLTDTSSLKFLHKVCRKAIIGQLSKLHTGSLSIKDPIETFDFIGEHPGPAAEIVIKDFEAYKEIALAGSIGAAESYMTADWSSDNLTNVIRVMSLNMDILESMESGMAQLMMPFLRLTHWMNRNSTKGAKRNIAAHYDLGNDFFELFLDPTMMYSSGVFPTTESTMQDASENKMRLICEQLDLKPQHHVVEIGSGWGSMAIYIAENYGCEVTTTTISKEQYEYARQRIKDKGLEDRIHLLLEDYRDLEVPKGSKGFDRLVSVEMIEAVGHQYYDEYFATIDSLLAPHGLALIQAITIEDHRYQKAKNRVDFIQKYIFPGSCIPSISAITSSTEKSSVLRLVKQHDFADHYARTLKAWHDRLNENREEITSKGYDEVFFRMWQFYLSYCEGGFKERAIGVSHLLFAKTLNRTQPRLNG